ncbi:hypothetical protein CBR_g25732 [Chara braunii]|uniref:Tf2-1-like SH3-like domain-containing protein n=1 Tax=Chara braunii TaxID=69332 RepID=A0A388L665_CHABU|nr:hypothetical protein CBR_g25732 [Chara braunii]|eukprot:GBG77801.1 hypothetical protein CBR_g25732 [Chara braunii]
MLAAKRQELDERKRLQAEGARLRRELQEHKDKQTATVLHTKQEVAAMNRTLQKVETHQYEFEGIWNTFLQKSAKDVDLHIQSYIEKLDNHITQTSTPAVIDKIVRGSGGGGGDGDGDGDGGDDKKGKGVLRDDKDTDLYPRTKEEGMTYEKLSKIAIDHAGFLAEANYCHYWKDLQAGKKWQNRTILGNIPGKDNLLLTFEEGGVKTLFYDQIDYGLEGGPNSTVVQEGDYAAVVARGGGRQGRGRGRGRGGRGRSGRGPGTQRGGGEGSYYVGGRGNGPSQGSRDSYSTWGRGRGAWYGRIFVDLLLPRPADIDVACSPSSVRKYREFLTQARANMQKAQVRMQQTANRRRVSCPIRTGDLVWVSAEEFALEQDVSRKLLPKWFGPWSVTAAAGDEPDGPSFVINIPKHLTVHPVFHTSKLATYTPAKSDDFPDRRSQDPPSMDGHQEVDRVISDRKYGSKPRQYKVTFKACDRDDTRWISGADLKASAPLI